MDPWRTNYDYQKRIRYTLYSPPSNSLKLKTTNGNDRYLESHSKYGIQQLENSFELWNGKVSKELKFPPIYLTKFPGDSIQSRIRIKPRRPGTKLIGTMRTRGGGNVMKRTFWTFTSSIYSSSLRHSYIIYCVVECCGRFPNIINRPSM